MNLGIIFKLCSAFLFTVMAALIRAIGDAAPTSEIVFARSFFALAPIVAWLLWRGVLRRAVATDRPFGHLLRSVIGISAMFCMFAALGHLPLADATALGYASPLFIVLFAAVALGERVDGARWAAVAVGFGGVIVMLWPNLVSGSLAAVFRGEQTEGAAAGAIYALAGAVLVAGAMVQIRRLTKTEGTGTIVFYFTVWSTMLAICVAPFAGWTMPDGSTAALLVLTGCVGGVAQILLTESYRHADASLIAPFEYSTILWALGIGALAFGDTPTGWTLIGGVIVIASGAAVALNERRLGLKRARLAKAAPQTPIG
ncbi:MAG: DMT family transporter [Hansschlegelia sp.]